MALYIPGLSEVIEFATDKWGEFLTYSAVKQGEAAIKRASNGNDALAREQIDQLHKDVYGSGATKSDFGKKGSGGLVDLQEETLRQLREKDRESTSSFVKWIVVAVVVVSVAYIVRLLKRG